MQTAMCKSARSSLRGADLRTSGNAAGRVRARRASFVVRAEEGAPAAAPEKPKWTEPKLDASTPSPIFGGSTGGLLRKAQTEEFYVITWNAKKEQIFEMPTGGAAIMREGPNLMKLARKEQCLALTTQLRTKFKTDACFYRVYPNGEVQYLHPKDGVYPEKVNAGRVGKNNNLRRIGQNKDPAAVKYTAGMGGFNLKPFELDSTNSTTGPEAAE